MLRRLAQVGGSVVMGAGLEALNRGVNQRTGGPQPATTRPGPSHTDGASSFERGDTKLSRLAGNIRPETGASPLQEGVHSFFTSRLNVASSAANVGSAVAQGKVGLKDVSESLEQAKEKVVFSARLAKVAGQGDLGTADGVRVAGAGARHAGEKALEALTQGNPLDAMRGMARAAKTGAEGAYASTTVSDSGMGAVKGAIDERAKHETQKVLTSAALSTGAGVVAGMINPGLGLAVRTLGGLAVGHQIGEAAGKIHGGSETGEVGAMRAEFRKIVEEKASTKP